MDDRQEFKHMIKFPTITKVAYSGKDQSDLLLRKTSMSKKNSKKINHHIANTTKIDFKIYNSHASQGKLFKVVQLPLQSEVMGICTLSIANDKARYGKCNSVGARFEPNSRQGKNKQIFIVAQEDGQKSRKNTLLNNQGAFPLRFLKFSSGDNSGLNLSKFSKINSLLQKKLDYSELYFQVMRTLALSYGVTVRTNSSSVVRMRRAKIEVGNNGLLVKQLIKKRSWWNTVKQEQNQTTFHLVWTERLLVNTSNNLCSYSSVQQDKSSRAEAVLPNNFHRVLKLYPKMMQLFFYDLEPKPQVLSEWFYSLKCEKIINTENVSISNHIPDHLQITDKKMLLQNMQRYYKHENKQYTEHLPKTYHITVLNCQSMICQIRQKQIDSGPWLLKPGENSNKGKGIIVFKNKSQGLDYILRQPPKTEHKSYLFQQYVIPLLYEGRKFDIRCFMLAVQIYDRLSFYWYEEGYVRTASQKFTLKNTSRSIHLTNDAVQISMENYDKYESGNKLSYSQLQRYLSNNYSYKFTQNILKQMKRIASDVCKSATRMHGNPQGLFFELFGLDFIISQHGIPYILQVNTNPSLSFSSNLLSRVITQVIQNTFRLVLDMLLPRPKGSPDWSQNFILGNKYSLIHSTKIRSQDNQY